MAAEIFLNSTILVISIVVICKGANWLVDSSSKIAKRLGVSELIIGLTIVAFGTSAPEFCVTVSAALRGAGDISVGNIIGSNIFNLGIILGGVAIIRNLKTNTALVHRDGFFLLVGSILAVVMLWDLELSRVEGLILFSMLFIYLVFLYDSRESIKDVEVQTGDFEKKDLFFLVLGLGFLLIGSHFLIFSSVHLARIFGISEWIIGATIIAAGTSAPEIATSIIAAIRGHDSISIGNLIGSDIFNIFGALGLAASLRSMTFDISARPSLIVYPIMVLFVLLFLRTGWILSRREGLVLFIFGIVRWTYSLLVH